MKILCVIDSLGAGGAQRQLVNLAVAFKKRGHDVSFLIYHEENFFKPLLDRSQIPVHGIFGGSYFKRLLTIRKFLRAKEYDGVLSFLEGANFICELAGVPYRKWILIVGERSSNPKILRSVKLRVYRLFHLFSDYVVANSQENIRLVRKINPFLNESRCRVVYNMVDFDKWRPDDHFVPLKGHVLTLVVVASHQYSKNAQGLIRALSLLDENKRNKLKVEWYGSPRNDDSFDNALALVNRYKLHDVISFYEETPEIRDKMRKADAIGLFSFFEGFPNVICEAFALGKAVIAPAVSDIAYFIKNKNLLFDPCDVEQISAALSYLLSLDSDQLIKIGVDNNAVGKLHFQSDSVVKSYLTLLSCSR